MNAITWRERLGFPDTTGRRRLVLIAAVDSFGTGVFLPLSVLYFVTVSDMSVATVGVALSVGAGIALLGGPYTGTLIDRFGPGRMAAASCLLRAAAFLAYLAVDQFWQVILLSALVIWGDSAFWPSNSAMIIALCGREQRARWYALGRTIRSMGMGIGAALSGVIVAAGSEGPRVIVTLNALTFAAVAVVLATWQEARTTTTSSPDGPDGDDNKRAGLRTVLADRPFLLIVASNSFLAVCALSLAVLLPLYAGSIAPDTVWLSGGLFAVNTALLMLAQGPAVRRIEASTPSRVLQAAVAFYAAGFAVFLLAPNSGQLLPVLVLFAAVVLYTAGELVHPPTSVIMVTDMARPELIGRYLSVNQLSWSVGNVITPALLAGLFASDARLPWLVLFAMCGATSGLLLLSGRRSAEPDKSLART
ncbi:MFS transporter [Streptomyces sp. NPDC051172]|uniref:MDR family MFS transporter n=1 Tax=Streptomyces sp. NPDC051172 TaxID=3155796 RepID=UPI00341E7A3D